jgi:hypothetical protein
MTLPNRVKEKPCDQGGNRERQCTCNNRVRLQPQWQSDAGELPKRRAPQIHHSRPSTLHYRCAQEVLKHFRHVSAKPAAQFARI